MSRWLKIDVNTPDKWQVVQVAEDCQCSIGDAFLAFFRVFAWLDELTEDGLVRKATPKRVDAVAQLGGFAASMQSSGWITFTADGMLVTNWCEHNGSCAKRRAQEARRMNALREEKRQAGEPVRPCPRRPVRTP